MGEKLAGVKQRSFQVPEQLLCSKSPFFKTALRGNNFLEATTREVKLPEEDPEIVNYFLHWLYTGKLSGLSKTEGGPSIQQMHQEAVEAKAVTNDNGQASVNPHWEQLNRELYDKMNEDAPIWELVLLYVLADYLKVPQLKDRIVNILFIVYSDTNNPFWSSVDCLPIMAEAYHIGLKIPGDYSEDKKSQSKISSVILRLTADLGPAYSVDQDLSEVGTTFLFQCWGAMRDVLSGRDRGLPMDSGAICCRYHIHNNTEVCSLDGVNLEESGYEEW